MMPGNRTVHQAHEAGQTIARVNGNPPGISAAAGRLVIEMSGPAADNGPLAGDGEDREAIAGRLALVRGTGTARREVTRA
jgi:hypothetical protein